MALNTSVPAIQFERAGETPALRQLEINGLVARLVAFSGRLISFCVFSIK
jgi:hypothetical protein